MRTELSIRGVFISLSILFLLCNLINGRALVITDASCNGLDGYNSILVIAAHPDDIETIAGGTVSLFTKCGKEVNYVITTNGDKGWGKDTSMTSLELAQIREVEQQKAALVLNVKNVTFLRQSDGRLDGTDPISLKLNITRAIRTFQPDLVLTFNPEIDYNTYKFGLMHEDHRLTGQSTMNSLWPSARDYLNFYDELYLQNIMPWICPEVWLFAFTNENSFKNYVVVDISGELYDKKLQALLQHQSQYTDVRKVDESLRNIGTYVANSFIPLNILPNSSMKYAEAFYQIQFL